MKEIISTDQVMARSSKQSDREKKIAQHVVIYYARMKGMRVNWDAHWDLITRYIMLNDKRLVFGNQVPGGGDIKFNTLFDATGVHANELLASALHSMLTSPTSFWFDLETGIAEVDNDDDVRLWLQKTKMYMHQLFNESNFQTEIHEVYLDLGSFGTTTMRIEKDKDTVIRFHCRPIFESYISENNKGVVDTIYRRFKWSWKQIAEEFGIDKLPPQFAKLVKDNRPDQLVEHYVIHAVYPREEWDNSLGNPKKYKFASCYVLEETQLLLNESGFRTNPYVTPRWLKVAGEVYGRSPGMKALGDIKVINEMQKTQLKSAQKTMDPPLQMPHDGFVMPVQVGPGDINFYESGTQDRIEPLLTGSRIDFGFQMMDDIRKRIHSAFFIDQLQLAQGPQMTATEVRQRADDQLRLLGPILGRQESELLRPMVERVFDILLEEKLLPQPIPKVLEGRNVQVKYISQIAKAQKISELDNFNRAIQTIGPVVQADPTAMDNINSDEAVKYIFKLLGTPAEILRKDKAVKDMRDQRQQAQEKQAQQQRDLAASRQVQEAGPTLMQAQQNQQAG